LRFRDYAGLASQQCVGLTAWVMPIARSAGVASDLFDRAIDLAPDQDWQSYEVQPEH
jgi:hypothetical protein